MYYYYYLREVLTRHTYPTCTLDRMEQKNFQKTNPMYTTDNTEPSNKSEGYTVMPLMQGLWEIIMNNCGKYGIETYSKGNRTHKDILATPKDKDQIQNVVYYTGIGVTAWTVMKST